MGGAYTDAAAQSGQRFGKSRTRLVWFHRCGSCWDPTGPVCSGTAHNLPDSLVSGPLNHWLIQRRRKESECGPGQFTGTNGTGSVD